MEKKSERLEVRLGYQEKQNFADACDLQGDTPSNAIRRFIKGYVKRTDSDILDTKWRKSAKRKFFPIIFASGLLAVLASATYAMVLIGTPPDADTLFSIRDFNGDEELSSSELGLPKSSNGHPNGIMRVLDIDASDTLSRAEFVIEGRMIFALNKNYNPSEENKSKATLVEFVFSKDHTSFNTFDDATINADGLDRLVIWPEEGGPIVFEGRVEISMGVENNTFYSDTVIQHKK